MGSYWITGKMGKEWWVWFRLIMEIKDVCNRELDGIN